MDDICANCGVHGRRDIKRRTCSENAVMRKLRFVMRQPYTKSFAVSKVGFLCTIRPRQCPVDELAGFSDHAKPAIGHRARDIFRCPPPKGAFHIVDCGGTVHRNVSDHSTTDQINDDGSETDLNHMSTHHQDDRLRLPSGCENISHQVFQITRNQHVGKSVNERAE